MRYNFKIDKIYLLTRNGKIGFKKICITMGRKNLTVDIIIKKCIIDI